MGSTRRLVALATVALSLVAVQSASAIDYCVAPNTTCGGVNTGTLQMALDLATISQAGDRIFLGTATYAPASAAAGFSYDDAGSVELIGEGSYNTILTGQSGGVGSTLSMTGGASTIRDLNVQLPANAAPGYVGLITDGQVRSVAVTEAPLQSSARAGVQLWGGSMRDSNVKLHLPGAANWGVVFGAPASLRNSTVTAQTAVDSNPGTVIDRSRLVGAPALAASSGLTVVKHSRIDGADPMGAAIVASNAPSGLKQSLLVDGCVITGPGSGTAAGIHAVTNDNPDREVAVTVVNSATRGTPRPFWTEASGPATATIAVTYSDFDAGATLVTGAQAIFTKSNNTDLGSTAGFVDPLGGDFRLLPGSPLIDAGDPSSAAGSGDYFGNPLDMDGDGDGVARRDIGFFEAPALPLVAGGPQAPTDPVAVTTPGSPATTPDPALAGDKQAPVLSRLAARRVRVRFMLSERAGVTIKLQRAVVVRGHKHWRTVKTVKRAAKSGGNSVRIGKRPFRRGAYRALVRATDAAGNRSAVKRVRYVR